MLMAAILMLGCDWDRFLHEDPWRRLDLLRQKVPNIPFQVRVLLPFLLFGPPS